MSNCDDKDYFTGDERLVNKECFLTTLAPLPDPKILQASVNKNVAEKARNIYQNISREIISKPAQVCSSEGIQVTNWIPSSTEKAIFELVNLALNRYGYELRVDENKCYLHIRQDDGLVDILTGL